MAVRTPAALVEPGASASCSLALIAGMWWWGFDFGQIFGGFNRKEVEARMTGRSRAEAGELRGEAARAARPQHAARKRARDDARQQQALSRQATELAERERAAQGGARVPAAARRRLRASRSGSRSSASPSSAKRDGRVALQHAGRARRQSASDEFDGHARRCRRRYCRWPQVGESRPTLTVTLPDDQAEARAGAEAQIQVLSEG